MTIRALLVTGFVLLMVVLAPAALLAQPPQPPQPPAPAAPAPPAPPPAPQARPPAPPPPPSMLRGPVTSLDVQVVIARYQGQKQVSSLPYSLAVTANAPNTAHLNMGTDVPVPNTTFAPSPPGGGSGPAAARPITAMSYRSVGTAISCRASGGEDGVFEVTIDVDDSSIFTSDQAAPPMPVPDAMPVFRSFKSRNTLLLKDGQSRQYTAAADRVSGEVVRVEVTLKVVP